MESPSPPLPPFIRILLFWWGNEEIGVEWKEEGGEELPFEIFSLPSFVWEQGIWETQSSSLAE